MRVLHIASLTNRKDSGVSIIVPQYFLNEKKINKETYLLNIGNEKNIALANVDNYYETAESKQALNYILEIKPKIVVIHEVYYPKYLAISNYLIANGIPYIIVPHGCLTNMAQKRKRIKKKIGNLFFAKMLKYASGYHFLSLKEKTNSKYGMNNSYVCGNGLNVPKKNNHIFSQKQNQIIYIGRVNFYHKGIDLLMSACNLSKDDIRNNNIKIKIYGPCDKITNYKIQKYIKDNKLSDILILEKPIYDDEKIKQLRTCLAFIQTSKFEGQPIGIMEAMAQGAPIIATSGTNFNDIVRNKKCGLGCETNEKSISAAIIKMINSKNIKDYSNNSFELARKEFSWRKISINNIKEYENRTKTN